MEQGRTVYSSLLKLRVMIQRPKGYIWFAHPAVEAGKISPACAARRRVYFDVIYVVNACGGFDSIGGVLGCSVDEKNSP